MTVSRAAVKIACNKRRHAPWATEHRWLRTHWLGYHAPPALCAHTCASPCTHLSACGQLLLQGAHHRVHGHAGGPHARAKGNLRLLQTAGGRRRTAGWARWTASAHGAITAPHWHAGLGKHGWLALPNPHCHAVNPRCPACPLTLPSLSTTVTRPSCTALTRELSTRLMPERAKRSAAGKTGGRLAKRRRPNTAALLHAACKRNNFETVPKACHCRGPTGY